MSTTMAEDLHKIKVEPTTQEKQPNNIKERLNLHVKRRLQDLPTTSAELTPTNLCKESISANTKLTNSQNDTVETSLKSSPQAQRTKRQYTKRKNKQDQQQSPTTILMSSSEKPRKYKRRRTYNNNANLDEGSAATETGAAISIASKIYSIETLEEDCEESNSKNIADGDMKVTGSGSSAAFVTGVTGIAANLANTREKDKCPDVLSMVLSMKKSSILQNKEVQECLSKIMKVLHKS